MFRHLHKEIFLGRRPWLFSEDKTGDAGAAGGGASGAVGAAGAAGAKGGDKGQPDPRDAKIAELEAALQAAKGKGAAGAGDQDPDLLERTRRAAAASDKTASDTKALENALKFGLQSEQFLKTNQALLPKDVADIFTQANKENYSNAIEKDQAIKAGIIQSFFSVQANVDLLTAGLKSQLDEYLKLTKNGKQEKAQAIYDTLFEPTFEGLKRLKKAEALSKGYGDGTDADDAYKNRLMKLTRQHYLGEKANA